MSANSRGTYNENYIAKVLPGGRKVSERGKPGHDVESRPMRLISAITRWEAKYMKQLPKWLREWQEQALRQGSPVIFRENRGKPWIMLPLEWLTEESEITEVTDLVQLTAEEISEVRQLVHQLSSTVGFVPPGDCP